MTLPVMEPDVDAKILKQWAQTIDEGPFSSLCWGERIAFANPDSLTLLGALSGWTERVPLAVSEFHPFATGLVAPFDLRSTGAAGDVETLARALQRHRIEDVSTGTTFGPYPD